MSELFFENQKEFLKNGLIILKQNEFPLNTSEWDELNEISLNGQIAEDHVLITKTPARYVKVKRLLSENDASVSPDSIFAGHVLNILNSQKMLSFLERLTLIKNLKIIRCQINCIPANSYI